MNRRNFFSLLARAAVAMAVAPANFFMPAEPEPLDLGFTAFDAILNKIYAARIEAELAAVHDWNKLAMRGEEEFPNGREIIFPISYKRES